MRSIEEIKQDVKLKHPDWTEDQVLAQTSVIYNGEITVSENQNIVAENDEDILAIIFKKAAIWVEANWPEIWARIECWFRDIINNIFTWIRRKGWDLLTEAFNIFS